MNMDGYGLYSYDVMDILRLRAGTWRLDAALMIRICMDARHWHERY